MLYFQAKKKNPTQSKSLNQKSLKTLSKNKKFPKANLKTIAPQSLRARATPNPNPNRRRRISPIQIVVVGSVQSRLSSEIDLVHCPDHCCRHSSLALIGDHLSPGHYLSLQASLLSCSGAPSLKVFHFTS